MLLVIVVFIGAVGLNWWLSLYRYRLTITLETPQGLVSASSVIEIELPEGARKGSTPEFGPFPGRIRGGTAPILDLGPRGTLVACMLSWGPHGQSFLHSLNALRLIEQVYQGFDKLGRGKAPYETWRARRQRRTLTTMTPLLVWLPANATDPSQAVPVSPAQIEQYMGSGVRFRSITIGPTSDAYATRIEPAPELLWAMRNPKPRPTYHGAKRFFFDLNFVETEYPPKQRGNKP